MRKLKRGVAKNLMILLVSSQDHVTGVLGASLTVSISKDGGAFSAISPSITERSYGWYNVALTSAHTDTIGDLVVHVAASGSDPSDPSLEVVAYDPNDAAGLGLSRVDATISSRLSFIKFLGLK